MLDTRVGERVGDQVRFDSCFSADTVIKYETDGCVLRECLDGVTHTLSLCGRYLW